MIDISTLNPLQLPSIPLGDKLPNCSCVYFVVDSTGRVLYVGKTKNLAKRWIRHHKIIEVRQIDSVHIAYLECDTDNLDETEKLSIIKFNPPFNKVLVGCGRQRFDRPTEWIHDEKKAKKMFMLTKTASSAIDAMATKLGISRSEVVERMIRCGGLQKARKFNLEPEEYCQNQSANDQSI